MPDWRYLLSNVTPEEAEDGGGGLVRLPVDGTVSLAEYVDPDGRWWPDDSVWKAMYRGAELNVVELGTEQAEALMRR